MRLEDALLHVEVKVDAATLSAAAATCEQIIEGGGDVIHLATDPGLDGLADALEAMAVVCRRDDALLVVRDLAELAGAADGVHLTNTEMSVPLARAQAGDGKLVGMSSGTVEEAMVALEVGVDYVLHTAGSGCAGAFAALRGLAGVPLVAGGLSGPDDARHVVERGIFRLGIGVSARAAGELRESVAVYSRILGRSL
jgi:thiamine-phosphate pyrophosphorylase